jgi:hypothetical protein
VRNSSSSSLAGRGGTSEGNDADVKWPDEGRIVRCGSDARGGEFGGCGGVDRPLPVNRKRKKRESGCGVGAGEGAGLSWSEPDESGTPCVSFSSMLFVWDCDPGSGAAVTWEDTGCVE